MTPIDENRGFTAIIMPLSNLTLAPSPSVLESGMIHIDVTPSRFLVTFLGVLPCIAVVFVCVERAWSDKIKCFDPLIDKRFGG